jgi:hypothetical protein
MEAQMAKRLRGAGRTVRGLLSMTTFFASIGFPFWAKADWVTLPASFTLWPTTYDADIIRVTSVPTPLTNPSGCADTDSYMVRTTLTKEAKSRIYASLMLAKATGKPVTVWVNGCESARPAIETVLVE